MEKIIKKIEKWQEKELEKERMGIVNVKYSFKAKEKDGDYDVAVHEYECPNGDVGYQILIYQGTSVVSKGYGAEALSRTY